MNKISRVTLLGHKGKLKFTQTAEALTVELPGGKLSDLTCTLKITGRNLKPAPMTPATAVVSPDSKGRLLFSADDAVLHGDTLKLEEQGGQPCIGYWDNASEWISWNARAATPRAYRVQATIATIHSDTRFVVEAGGENLTATVPMTGGWEKFQTIDLGRLQLKNSADLTLTVRAQDTASWKPINLNSIQLIPVN